MGDLDLSIIVAVIHVDTEASNFRFCSDLNCWIVVNEGSQIKTNKNIFMMLCLRIN
jgi:hypothetical protein